MKLLKKSSLIIGMALPMMLSGCDFGQPPHQHVFDYDNPVWVWSEDLSSATVKFNCKDGDSSTDPVTAEISVDDKQPTCTEGAVDTYTATAIVGGVPYTDTQTKTQESIGHNYTSIEVSGSFKTSYSALEEFDLTGLIVKKVCANNPAHKELVTSGISVEYEHGDELHAGDQKVTIRVGDFSKDVTVTVAKLVPTISGLPETLSSTCHVMPSFEGVTSTLGTVVTKVYSNEECTNEVAATDLVAGTYYVKAVVAGTDEMESAQATSVLTVSHDYEMVVDQTVIGYKHEVCGCNDQKDPEKVAAADIDFTANKYGAKIFDISSGSDDDQSWMISTSSTPYAIEAKNMPYKNYGGKTWKNVLPAINLNAFECVSYDLSITNWANGVKVGFEDTVADTGFALAKETKDGGKVIIAKTANDKVLVKMVSASYGLDISKEFVGEGYVNGTTPIAFYSTASDGDYFFRLNNFAFAESHDFVNELQSEIGLVNKQCSHCGLAVETTDLPEIDFAVNHYGATYLKGDSDDQHWKLGVSSAGIEYKLYGDPMTEFTLVMPKVNFNQFKDVSFEFEAPNWYENNGFGFTKEEAEGGTHHTTYGGSKTGTLSFGWEGEKLIATFDFEFISMSTEVTSAAVKSGEEGFKLYVTDAYDRSITLKKINLFTEHAYGDPVVSQDCIALSKQTCANGKHSTVSMPTIDFGANHFGATYLKDDNDDQHWKLGVSSDGIEYKLYGSEKTEFTLVLPKVKFTDFADVEFDLSAPNWYENNGFGFTKEEAEGGTHHTTYGGSKTGTLKFGWNDSELVATLSFGNLKMSTVVNDEEVKSGTKGFKLYVTDLYDRSLIVTDVKLFDEHSFGNQIVSSDKIATVKEKCSNGDHERSVGVPTIDFGTNHFGATYLKDDSDDQSWKLGVSSDGIAYNLYGDPMTEFTLVLPKVDFGNFTEVKFNLIASNWYENNGFGFTKAEAEGGTYHTTYGGSKDGTLTFSWNDNKLLVEFKFEHVEMSTEISDADVINGNNGFKLYVTNAYDRSIIVTNVNLQAK